MQRLYGRLRGEGIDVWLDEKNILPGQDWDAEIRRAVRAADLVIVCLSKASIEKTGYVQREIRMVLDLADEQPEDKIYLIPARLELCDVPHRLTRWQWVDLFDPEGYNRLLSAVRTVAERLDLPATTGDLAARRSLQNGGPVSTAGMRQLGATDLPPAPADDTLPLESGSAQESMLRPEPRRGQGFAEDTTSPRPGRGGGTGSSESQSPVYTPSLPMLRDHKERLSAVLEVIEMSPDTLDVQAGNVHQELVMPVYELMRTEVARACGSDWDPRDRQRFAERYRAAANKWPAYREALAGLERARDLDTSVNDAMVRLERPRSDYIAALLSFCEEFFGTLDFFFPT